VTEAKELKFTKEHEWLRIEGNRVTVGITDFAQKKLGDIVYVELPELDEEFVEGDAFAVLESVKTAADVYAPVDGIVVEVNDLLEDEPSLVNTDPFGEGWIAVFEAEGDIDPSALMDAAGYRQYVAEEE
jgi:glycine cleavage system H protein